YCIVHSFPTRRSSDLHLNMAWHIEVDGEILQSGTIPVPNIVAHETKECEIPYKLPESVNSHTDYLLNISYTLATRTEWAEQGHRSEEHTSELQSRIDL